MSTPEELHPFHNDAPINAAGEHTVTPRALLQFIADYPCRCTQTGLWTYSTCTGKSYRFIPGETPTIYDSDAPEEEAS